VRGESSPQYTLYPRYEGVPARIASVVPDAKLVYIVRDPFERLLSNYARHLAYGHGSSSLEHVLNGPDRALYVDASRYWTQLEQYLHCLPREQILVIDLDDLQQDASGVLRALFEFVGVDPDFQNAAFASVHNQGPLRQNRATFRWAGTLLNAAVGEKLYKRLRPMWRMPESVRAALSTELEPPVMEPRLREQLEEVFRVEATRLREFTGLPLAT
jgi:hypothetical protein